MARLLVAYSAGLKVEQLAASLEPMKAAEPAVKWDRRKADWMVRQQVAE